MKPSFLLLSMMAAAATGAAPALAGETCYGFSEQTDGQVFNLGETVAAKHLKVHVRGYQRDGVAVTPGPGTQFVRVQSTALADSKSAEKSELYIYNRTMQIVPHSPVAQIRMRLAENRGAPSVGRHANLEINGAVHEVAGSLRALDGREFDTAGGRVRVEVTLRPHTTREDKWFDGTMKARALSGQINSFGIGSAPLVVNDVCITPNAPRGAREGGGRAEFSERSQPPFKTFDTQANDSVARG